MMAREPMEIVGGNTFPEKHLLLELSEEVLSQLERTAINSDSNASLSNTQQQQQVTSSAQQLVLRGRPDDTAVLCTPDGGAHFVCRVHTSNSLYIIRREPEIANPSPDSGQDQRGGDNDAVGRVWAIQSCLDSVLELSPARLKLVDRVLEVLRLDERGEYRGPDFESPPKLGPKENPVVTLDILQRHVQASDSVLLKTLKQIPAICLPPEHCWRKLNLEYALDTLRLIIATSIELDWSTNRISLSQCVEHLVEADGNTGSDDNDDNEAPSSNLTLEVLRTVLEFFGEPCQPDDSEEVGGAPEGQGGDWYYKFSRDKITRFIAVQLLESEKDKVWDLAEFVSLWKAATPPLLNNRIPSFERTLSGYDCDEVSRSLLRGLAFVTTSNTSTAGCRATLHPLFRDRLPLEPIHRFRALFSAKPRWARPEIEPFLVDLVGAEDVGADDASEAEARRVKKAIDTLLLKYTRSTKRPDGVMVHTQRIS